MTREEIENIPKNVNALLGLSVTPHTRQKLVENLNKVCELALMELEQKPKISVTNGDIIETMFEVKEIRKLIKDVFVVLTDGAELGFSREWWTAPYKTKKIKSEE